MEDLKTLIGLVLGAEILADPDTSVAQQVAFVAAPFAITAAAAAGAAKGREEWEANHV